MADQNCVKEGCNRQRYKGSLMCRPCTVNLRMGNSGPNKTSDGVMRKNKVTPEMAAEMRRMWSRFTPVKDIAAHFEVTVNTVHRAIKKARVDHG